MIDFVPRGGVFDVDDTLLDNMPGVVGRGLHERSRIAAVQAVGRKRGIAELVNVTPQQNLDAFLTSPVHSLDGAVWNLMFMLGLADSEQMNPEDEILMEIVAAKNDLHVDILREHGQEVPGSTEFVRNFAALVAGRVAVASTAIRRDIDAYFAMVGLNETFPPERILSYESITHPKPHPEIFDRAFLTLGLPDDARPQVAAFEDDPRGVMSAKAAGLFVCAITTRFSRTQFEALPIAPDLVADSYAEFGQAFGLAA